MTDRVSRQIDRERRARRRQRLLSSMSWGTFVLAFAGFFIIWHKVSTTPLTTTASAQSTVSSTSSQSGSGLGDSGGYGSGSSGDNSSSSGGSFFGGGSSSGGASIGQSPPSYGSSAS